VCNSTYVDTYYIYIYTYKIILLLLLLIILLILLYIDVTVYIHVRNIALLSRLLVSITDTIAEVFQTLWSRQHVTCPVRSVYLQLRLRCSQLLGGFHHLALSHLPSCHGCLHHPATQSVKHKGISMRSTSVAACTNR